MNSRFFNGTWNNNIRKYKLWCTIDGDFDRNIDTSEFQTFSISIIQKKKNNRLLAVKVKAAAYNNIKDVEFVN